ncbi:fatty acid desaturase [Caulobacter sp. 17J80-11]|uniref:fatty acid desaturase n=1 Tax=Caulobacter sp. 17J80-11 TaxID=2763502 RepID=UPI001653DEA8|nr:fatty acid desaturase [Caulobacter sp. 17J80-11]MBC6983563.1 fatty acid desaturase [Caulobacter sp. 17J80-11]
MNRPGDVAPPSLRPDEAAQAWPRTLAVYRTPSTRRGLWELVVTAGPLALLWGLAWTTLERGWWWGLLLAVPAAGFLVRLFMIQHDCGHGAFFPRRAANDWVGRAIGVLTLTPYDCWRRQHASHHAGSGNLDRDAFGGIETLAVADYLAMSWPRRLRYRLFRHPLVQFGLGPAYLFLLQQRVPFGFMRKGWRSWISAMGTNLAFAAFAAAGAALFGTAAFLGVYLLTLMLAATAGVWLFYVQHQFERTFWARDGEWVLQEAALKGSSYYELPTPLRWLTANIGVHHVHHLNSRIPFYRLYDVLKDHPELTRQGRLTLRESLGCVRLALWDEASGRLVSFRDLRRA